MIVSDVMTTNVVTIPSSTSLADARRIMDAHRFRRLPVVDRGKLVGIVTKDALDRTGPSQMTTFSMHEISYLLNKITVEQVMRREVVTVSPNTTVEEAVALAQRRKVGSALVTEGDKIIGILTTNDFFYKVMNPILGIGDPGSRIVVRDCHKGSDVEKAIAAINRSGCEISTLFTIEFPEVKKHDLVLHLESSDCAPACEAVRELGFAVEERAR